MRALMLLPGLLAGCASVPEVITVATPVEIVRTETVPVPQVLLRACEVDLSALKSNQDLESALGAAILELQRCTDDKVAISELE